MKLRELLSVYDPLTPIWVNQADESEIYSDASDIPEAMWDARVNYITIDRAIQGQSILTVEL